MKMKSENRERGRDYSLRTRARESWKECYKPHAQTVLARTLTVCFEC